MPVSRNYNYTDRTYSHRISCSRCDTVVRFDSPSRYSDGTEVDQTTGQSANEIFRWIPSRSRWNSACRECERAALNAARAARRESGATTNPTGTRIRTGSMNVNRKFGVEFEVIMPRNRTMREVTNALAEAGLRTRSDSWDSNVGWYVKGDGSLRGGNGMEIVSPPLRGEAGLDEVQVALRVLRSLGAKVNKSCGTHVHHDVADLDVDQFKRTVTSWFNNQPIIDGLVAPSRRAHGDTQYTNPIREGELQRVLSCQTLREIRQCRIGRYRSMNIQAYSVHGTIEIRQHQGTVDFEKVRSWIKLGQAIIDQSKVETVPAASRVRDMLNNLGTMIDSTAKTFLIGRAVEFDAVAV